MSQHSEQHTALHDLPKDWSLCQGKALPQTLTLGALVVAAITLFICTPTLLWRIPGKPIIGIEIVTYETYDTALDHERGQTKTKVYYKLHAEDGTYTLSNCPPSFVSRQWNTVEQAPTDGERVD